MKEEFEERMSSLLTESEGLLSQLSGSRIMWHLWLWHTQPFTYIHRIRGVFGNRWLPANQIEAAGGGFDWSTTKPITLYAGWVRN